MTEDLLLRSFMFLPAYNRKFITKAVESNADAIILDMEDSVPDGKKIEARNVIRECQSEGMFEKKKTFIRINNLGTNEFVNDISELCLPDIDGYMPSKIDSAEDIVFIDKLLGFMEMKHNYNNGKYLLAPLIETTKALIDVNRIAFASNRLVALCLGGEDYLNDLGSVYTYQESALVIPRALVVNAARAAGLLPIDTPYLKIESVDELEKKEKEAYKNGFAGCLILNPKQIDAVNKAFSPDDEKVKYSYQVLNAVKENLLSGNGSVVRLNDIIVGPPMRKRAESVVKQNLLKEEYENGV